MCGIAACIKKHGVIDRAKFESMTDIVSHRGPDDRGTFYDGELALGHRRLAIIDLSRDGHQPFALVDGYVLVFNGEIYNYIELRQELSEKGYQFQTQTDTEIIIIAYKEWGKECVNHFNGMWSFVLFDKGKKLLFCSRDRFGIKPFYYTEQEGMFLIASEMKQFFEILVEPPKAHRQTLMQYLIRGTTDQIPYTFFDGVFQLEPGYNLLYDLNNHKWEKESYYNLTNSENNCETYDEACDIFRKAFMNAVKLRLRADVPVGYFLSGGLDSSSIVCAADKLIQESGRGDYREQHTISSCYNEKRYDEQEYIDEVIRATKVTPHKVFPRENELWKNLDKIIWYMDEPISGMTNYPQWEVCAEAKKQGLTVMLDGQGSDEQLAGYIDFYIVYFIHLLKRGRFKKMISEIKSFKRLAATTEQYVKARDIIVSAIKDILTPKELDKFFKYVDMVYRKKVPFRKEEIKDAIRREKIYPRRDEHVFAQMYMKDELMSILHHLDRKSMAFSIEIRDPFLDYRLVEEIMKMPIEYKIRDGYTKAVLRDGLRTILPEKIRKRSSKLAFDAPQEKWINDNREMYRERLLDALKVYCGFLDTEAIIKWYDSKKNITRADSFVLWRIIDSSRWINVFHVHL